MHFRTPSAALVALAVPCVLAAPAAAQLVFTTDEAAFTAGLLNPTVEEFDGAETPVDENNSPITLFGLTFSVTGTSNFDDLVVGGDNVDVGIGSSGYDSVTIGFPMTIDSFGGQFDGLGSARLTTDNGDSFTIADEVGGSEGFVGFTSAVPFDSITLDSANGNLDIFDIESVVYGNVIPEPAAASLLAVGALAGLRRRRR